MMPAMAPALVQRFHQMPRTSAGNRPAAARLKAQATMATMSAGRPDATQAAMIATPISRMRAMTSLRSGGAFLSIMRE